MEEISKTVKPVYEGFWKRSDKDILSRLDEAVKKLNDRRTEMKSYITEEAHQQENQVSPSDRFVTCKCLMEQHLMKCSRDTLQHDLKEMIHQIPVEPLTAPPKTVHPFFCEKAPTFTDGTPIYHSKLYSKPGQACKNENRPCKQ